jgi:hypothetical protein
METIIKVRSNTYRITDEPILDNDMIWNEPSHSLDKCVLSFSDGTMVVEFDSGARAVLNKLHYQKAVKI